MTRRTMIQKWLKNLLTYGVLFIALSVAVDWYRKPAEAVQFADKVLQDSKQQPKVLAQLSHEKPLLLYFWGSWCHFCAYTSPAIQQLNEEGIPVLGVALKSGSDEEVNAYLSEQGYHFDSLNDPTGSFSKAWDIQATPTILIIKQGKIAQYTTGLTSYWGLKARYWLARVW